MVHQYLTPKNITIEHHEVIVDVEKAKLVVACVNAKGAGLLAAELSRFARTFDIPNDRKYLEQFIKQRVADSWEWNPTIRGVELWRRF